MEKIKQTTVVEQVMARIKDLIASGQYKPGDRLPTEAEMAEQFGIGRSSLREAIKIFNYLGILESHASKGTFVCDRSHISAEALSWAVLLGGDELYELIEIRAAIELWSLLLLADHYREDNSRYEPDIGAMANTIRQMRTAIAAEDFNRNVILDFEFHDLAISSSGNSLFVSIYHTLRSFMIRTSTKIHQDSQISSDLPDIHERLLQAVRSGSHEDVIREMQNHIQTMREKLDKI